ncbi:MAG: hypothetical protein HLUCCO07_01135 [Rhodobacteraceae bacterium HLUCCO07]|nr:MAG: hypothetical protein HLUCCO07_01135 [Rhodobacteraceae bacterium HLUCCO07]
MIWVVWIVLAAVVAFGAWVRLAPSDPARWHVMPAEVVDRDFEGGVMRVARTGPEGLARLDEVARGWPRTRVLAGSVEEGMVTYVTRSAVWGFPDYTTARQAGDRLEIHARLRFGRGDMGVNRKRVEAWLADL